MTSTPELLPLLDIIQYRALLSLALANQLNDSNWEGEGPIYGENLASPATCFTFLSRKWNLDGGNHLRVVWIFFAKTVAGAQCTSLVLWNRCFPNLFDREWENNSGAGLSYCTNNIREASYGYCDISNAGTNGWPSEIISCTLRTYNYNSLGIKCLFKGNVLSCATWRVFYGSTTSRPTLQPLEGSNVWVVWHHQLFSWKNKNISLQNNAWV